MQGNIFKDVDRMTKNNKQLNDLILSGVYLAIGLVLPLLTMQVKEIGDSLLPMHLPVMLCGMMCGSGYGLVIGALLPVVRAFLFGMPPLYPNAVWMAAELATYGFIVGILYNRFFKKQLWWIYASLVISMISGRVVWGIVKLLLLSNSGKLFTFGAFITGGFIDAIPGIILQLLLIPLIIMLKNNYRKG